MTPRMTSGMALAGRRVLITQASDFMGAVLGSSDASPGPSMGTITLGGKQVYSDGPIGSTASDDPTGGFVTAYYPKGDVLFMVIASAKDADAIFAALP